MASTTNDVTFEEKRLFSLRLCTESIATPSNFKESRITKAQSLRSGTFPGLTHTNQVRNLSHCGSASLRVIWGYSYLLFRVVRKSKRVNIFFFSTPGFSFFIEYFKIELQLKEMNENERCIEGTGLLLDPALDRWQERNEGWKRQEPWQPVGQVRRGPQEKAVTWKVCVN